MAYEFDGKKYESASAHQKEWGMKIIEELGLRGTEAVLDLGCGDGTLTARIAEFVPRGEVVGIDASQGMIDVARKKEAGNLRFVLMDINDLDFSERFDVAFSNATLHWVRDHMRLLRNVRRALRHDGVLRFNFAGEGNCSHFFKVIREAMELPGFSRYFEDYPWPWYMPPVAEYRTLLEQAGYRDARVWGENADRFFSDEEAMVRWIDQPSLVPFLARVAEESKADFRRFVVERMTGETRQADGTCFETFRRINVFAHRQE
jgi:trans-aconitate 2-methyltransferase